VGRVQRRGKRVKKDRDRGARKKKGSAMKLNRRNFLAGAAGFAEGRMVKMLKVLCIFLLLSCILLDCVPKSKGEKIMSEVQFKKMVNGKMIDISVEEGKKLARPALLKDKKSIEIVREYTKVTRARLDAMLQRAEKQEDRLRVQGMISSLMLEELALTGIKEE
jgi:hypothetical protein